MTGSGDGGVGKQANSDAGSGKDQVSGSQSEKRTSKNERKAETLTLSSPPPSSSSTLTADEGKDGMASSADVYGRVSSSGRVIKQTNKGRCFTAAREAAQNKQSTPAASHAHGSGTSTGTDTVIVIAELNKFDINYNSCHTNLTKGTHNIMNIALAAHVFQPNSHHTAA